MIFKFKIRGFSRNKQDCFALGYSLIVDGIELSVHSEIQIPVKLVQSDTIIGNTTWFVLSGDWIVSDMDGKITRVNLVFDYEGEYSLDRDVPSLYAIKKYDSTNPLGHAEVWQVDFSDLSVLSSLETGDEP